MFVSFFIIYMTCIYIMLLYYSTCCIFSFLTIFLNQLYYKVHVVGEPNATASDTVAEQQSISGVDVVNLMLSTMVVVAVHPAQVGATINAVRPKLLIALELAVAALSILDVGATSKAQVGATINGKLFEVLDQLEVTCSSVLLSTARNTFQHLIIFCFYFFRSFSSFCFFFKKKKQSVYKSKRLRRHM